MAKRTFFFFFGSCLLLLNQLVSPDQYWHLVVFLLHLTLVVWGCVWKARGNTVTEVLLEEQNTWGTLYVWLFVSVLEHIDFLLHTWVEYYYIFKV